MTKEEASSAAGQSTDRYFDTEHLKTDLKGRAIRGGAVTMCGQVAKIAIRMGSMMVLCRLLTPVEYGLVGMVMPVTEFVLMFKDMGLSIATIQRAEVNHAQISTLFWVNVGIGVLRAGITAALAPLIAWYDGVPELIPVTLVLSVGLAIGGLAIQHQALLKRHMRFAVLAVIEVISMAVGFGTAIIAAVLGAGYWSLVLMHLAIAGAMAVGVWLGMGWRPGWPSLHCGVRSMLNFGRNVIGFRMVNYFARNSDKILIGRFCGANVLARRHTLGLYGRAYGLLTMPLSQITWPITSVAMPALSRIQDDPKRYSAYYTRLIQLLSFITMPLVVFLAICSKSVINVVIGSQWTDASRIFQVLAVTAFIQPVSSTAGIVLLSLGRSGRLLKFGIFNSSFIVLGFVAGLKWGAVGVAAGYAIASYVILLPGLWYCFRGTPVSLGTSLRAIGRPIVASLVMGFAIMWVHSYLPQLADIAVVCISFVVALCAYLLVWISMPGGIRILRDFAGYIALLYHRKESAAPDES